MAKSLMEQDASDKHVETLADDIVHKAMQDLKAARTQYQHDMAADQQRIRELQAKSTANMTKHEVKDITRQEHELLRRIHHDQRDVKHFDTKWEIKAMKDERKHARNTMGATLQALYREFRDATDPWMKAPRRTREFQGPEIARQEDVDVIMAVAQMHAQAETLHHASNELIDALFGRVCERIDDRAEKMKAQAEMEKRSAKELQRAQKANGRTSKRIEELQDAAEEIEEGRKEEATAAQQFKAKMKEFDLYVEGLQANSNNATFVNARANELRKKSQLEYNQKRSEVQQSLMADIAKWQKLAARKDSWQQSRAQESLVEQQWRETGDAVRNDKQKPNDLDEMGERGIFEDEVRYAEKEEMDTSRQLQDAMRAYRKEYENAAEKVKEASRRSGVGRNFRDQKYDQAREQWHQFEREPDDTVDLSKQVIRELYNSVESGKTASAPNVGSAAMSGLRASQTVFVTCALVVGLAAMFSLARFRRSMPHLSQEPLLG
eukprot:gnl/TRDRNA2_/TRDRNA2_177852_c0_seq2.p1 gnl/TRDRNA2_/TRDRNA2_177852_c0~~gnl/TRDRNA2_/TRDRNA2_177852_c0_seq2.p1  ORF type:complete len:493 (+),score=120.86 gnl/TRDRNA2_/TRDRNA2_177852_c0_seq2:708-2186(+)